MTGWREALGVYRRPVVIAMALLGFSAGLPLLLVFSTLSAWLREAGISLGSIGLLSYVLTAYSIKVLWAPVVDRLRLPLLTAKLGRRRGWMLLAQAIVIAGLWAMSQQDPRQHVGVLVWLALLVAFASATQDIVVDAWRIEAAPDGQQAPMATAYQLGYRIAILAASAGALWLAGEYDWRIAYSVMATLAGVGFVTTLAIREPEVAPSKDTVLRERRVIEWLAAKAHWPSTAQRLGGWFVGAIVCPLTDFFQRNGLRLGLTILCFIGLFRLTDITMGVMANPFYIDLGYSKQQIAAIAKVWGVLASIAGIVLGGVSMARVGVVRSLMIGGLLVILSNLTFGVLALHGKPSVLGLAAVVSADNLAYNFAGTAFIAYLSGLTNTAYTATQYALFSSLFTLPGKILGGFSGFVVEAVDWPLFFVYTSALGVPALALLVLLTRRLPPAPPPAAPTSGGASPART